VPLTSQNASTAIAIGDRAAGSDTELRSRETVVVNSILAVAKLADVGAIGSRKVEAAGIGAANKGISTGCKSREGDEALHVSN